MRKTVVVAVSIFTLLLSQLTVPVRAAMSTPQSIVVYSIGILGAVEAVNLLVRAIIKFTKKKPKIVTPLLPVQTNVVPRMTNLIVIQKIETNVPVVIAAQTNTNQILPVPIKLSAPVLVSPQARISTTNRTVVFSWLSDVSNRQVMFRIVTDQETNLTTTSQFEKKLPLGEHFWKVQTVVDPSNRSAWSEMRGFQIITNIPLYTSTAMFSNLTESEKDDIRMFGADYYYLVSLAYYKVKKYDKSREFMFHSLAIGSRVEEGTKFLKQAMKLKDKEIVAGVARYRRSR